MADTDFEFINLVLSHEGKQTNAATPAVRNFTQGGSYLNNVQNYYVSVARLSFGAYSLPLLVPTFVTGSNYSQNKTIYTFTLSFTGTSTTVYNSAQTNIIYVPSSTAYTPYTGVVDSSKNTLNPYYYVWDYWSFCKMMNVALTTAFNDLKAQATGDGFSALAVAPKFYYSNTSQSLVFNAQKLYYDDTLPNPISVYFNNQLAVLLNGFYADNVANDDPLGKENRMIIEDQIVNTDPYDNTLYAIQPYSFDTSYWSPVQTIQIITNFGINPESVQNIDYSYGLTNNVIVPQNPSPGTNLLTDFQIDISSVSNVNSIFTYNKTDNFRWADILASGNLKEISIQVMWTDYANNQIPLLLPPGVNVTIKLAFLDKKLFDQQKLKV